MDKTAIYVKKIFIFLLITFGVIVAFNEIARPLNIIAIPIALLTISLLHLGFAGVKPPYLFVLKKTDEYINNKNNFWVLMKPLVVLIGLIYDIVVWTLWGVYLIYDFILDIIQLIKNILYWIFFGILWFLKLYVPAIRLLYKWFIHYIIKWPWWLYKLAFVNINNAFKRNYYFVSVWGTIIGLFLIFLFYYLAIITDIFGLTWIGFILAILPLSWSFGEISNIKKENLVQKPYWEVKKNFNNGMESVRNILIYMLIFLVLAIIQILLDLLGWIPSSGYTFLGIAFNINNLISFILIVLTFVLLFAHTILPTNLLFGGKSQPNFNEMLSQLGIISRKFLRVIFVSIPSSIFGSIVLVLPVILFVLTVMLSIKVKDNVLQTKINKLKNSHEQISSFDSKYNIEKEIDKLTTYQKFPFVTFNDIISIDQIKYNIKTNQNNIGIYTDKQEQLNKSYDLQKAVLSSEIEKAQQIPDPIQKEDRLIRLENERKSTKEFYDNNSSELKLKKYKAEIDIKYDKNYMVQTYIVFFFIGTWFAIFGGFTLAFLTSFMGNIFYDLFHFKEDGKPVYLMQKVHEENETDSHQPLIGFTLLIITVALIIYCNPITDFIVTLFA